MRRVQSGKGDVTHVDRDAEGTRLHRAASCCSSPGSTRDLRETSQRGSRVLKGDELLAS